MAQRILTLILLLCSSIAFASGLFGSSTAKPQFLPTDQAFNFTYQQQDHQLVLKWQISPDYYLYRQEIAITAENSTITSEALPDGLPHKDEFFGDTAIYRQQLLLPVTINNTQPGATVTVTYQGCAEAGFCYPPQIRQITLHPVTPMPDTVGTQTNQVADTTSNNTTVNTQSVAGNITADTTSNTGQLPFNPLWALLIGIGIAFTPCVLPMYPLISGIVLGGKQRLSTRRTLWLSLVYVQGMAVTYTVLGVVVALAGLKFQAAFQSPWVLIGLSMVFILLALSMFGLFTLQLPSSIQTRLTLISNHQKGGATWGVFSMGAIAGLICSPCTTAPLSAILLYIAQSGNLWQGAGTLYLYAFGMGLPLIAVTLFGNRLLPKSGPWMQNVKIGFGFVILALPVFLLERIVDTNVGLLMWAALGTAFFAWLFIISLQSKRRWMWPVQICCLLAALAVLPVQQLLFSPAVSDGEGSHLGFTQIHNSAQLKQALLSAKGKPVMLDLYADWCVACKEFEKYTFTDPQVQKALDNVILLQINMTRTTQETAALSDQLEVIGLPTILFFNPQGEELTEQRVIGFMDADHFLAHINSK